MSDEIIARRVWSKKLPHNHRLATSRSPHSLTATGALHRLGGNDHPHFSLTGEVSNDRKVNDPVVMGGCIHDEILKEWPELAPLAAVHLADEHGVPMHAVANGAYWLGFTEYQTAKYAGPNGTDVTMPYFPHFCSTWRVTAEETAEAYNWCLGEGLKHYVSAERALEVLAAAMLPLWAADAHKALAILIGDPLHDCGMCDGKLTFAGMQNGTPTWTCTVCDYWHIATDCCESS